MASFDRDCGLYQRLLIPQTFDLDFDYFAAFAIPYEQQVDHDKFMDSLFFKAHTQ